MSLEDVGGNAEIWEKAARKLRGRLMPPPGSRQPSQTEVEAFISSLEDLLDKMPAPRGVLLRATSRSSA
jgi:hypothetical protein